MRARTGRSLPTDFFEALDAFVVEALEGRLSALPDAHHHIARLRHLRCVASSTPVARLRWKLERTRLIDLFAPHLFSAEMVARGKPAPDLFLHAAATLGVDAQSCVVVEDSPNGVLAGKAAGMGVIGLTAGGHCLDGHSAMLAASGADLVIEAYAGLDAAIAELAGRLGRTGEAEGQELR